MSEITELTIDGEVAQPLKLSFDDLCKFSEDEHERDVSRYHPKRRGDGVTLAALLNRVQPKPEAKFLTLHASHDDFAASVPLEAIGDEGILVYVVDEQPLPVSSGGPFRFLIRNPAVCQTDELDDCANVKFVDRMEFSSDRGRDTRPTDEEEHAALHEDDHDHAH